MRILDLNNNYAPTGGGVRTYHEEKLRWAAGRDDVKVALMVPSDRFTVEDDGAAVRIHVPGVPLGGSGYRFVVRRAWVARAVEAFAPDLVELGSPYVLPHLVRRCDPTGRLATVGFYHSDVPDTLVRPPARRWFGAGAADAATATATRWLGGVYGRMTATFGASEFVLRKLAASGVRRLFHTPLGVDLEAHGPARRSASWRDARGVAPGEPLVLCMSRLAPEKGVRDLLAAWPRVSSASRARLVVVGHGPLASEVDALIARDARVSRLGFLSDRAEVAAAYASADVCLSLGAVETFSLSTLEALVSGTPVIAPDAGGAGEQVARLWPAGLYRPGDAASLAAAIDRAVAAVPHDRARLAAAARIGAGWDEVFSRTLDVCRGVLAAHRRGDVRVLDAPVPPGWWRPDEFRATRPPCTTVSP